MSTCSNCRFYKTVRDVDGDLCDYGSCYANPPTYAADCHVWARPKVYPEDTACRLFQPEPGPEPLLFESLENIK